MRYDHAGLERLSCDAVGWEGSVITLIVEGKPQAWGRPRKRKFGGYYSPHKQTPWYHAILWEATKNAPDIPWAGPLRLDIAFRMPRPKAERKAFWHTKRPDRDNLEKLVSDALKDAKLFIDDAQICTGDVQKRYVIDDEKPGATITLDRIDEPK